MICKLLSWAQKDCYGSVNYPVSSRDRVQNKQRRWRRQISFSHWFPSQERDIGKCEAEKSIWPARIELMAAFAVASHFFAALKSVEAFLTRHETKTESSTVPEGGNGRGIILCPAKNHRERRKSSFDVLQEDGKIINNYQQCDWSLLGWSHKVPSTQTESFSFHKNAPLNKFFHSEKYESSSTAAEVTIWDDVSPRLSSVAASP